MPSIPPSTPASIPASIRPANLPVSTAVTAQPSIQNDAAAQPDANQPSIKPTLDPAAMGALPTITATNLPPHVDAQADTVKNAVIAGPLATRLSILSNTPQTNTSTTSTTTGTVTTDPAVQNPAVTALQERHAVYQNMIATHQGSITTLETEIKAIDQRIYQKTSSAQQLLQEKTRLLSKIDEKRKLAGAAAAYGGLMAVFTFGTSAAIGGAAAAAATAAVVSLSNDLKSVERSKNQADSELRSLKDLSSRYQNNRKTLQDSLQNLKAAYADLQNQNPVTAGEPLQTVEVLQKVVSHDQKIVANLESQIILLKSMRQMATGHEAKLDAIIQDLQKNVDGLKKQLAQVNRQLWSSLIDIAILSCGTSASLRLSGLNIAKKEMILAAVDFSQGNDHAIVDAVVNTLLKEGLIAATGSQTLSTVLRTLLTAPDANQLLKTTLRTALSDPNIVGDDTKSIKALLDAATSISQVVS